MLYAATDTSAVPAVTEQLQVRQRTSSALIATPNFAISAPIAASALPIRLRRLRTGRARWGGSPKGFSGGRVAGTAGAALGYVGAGGGACSDISLSMAPLWQHP
jgi:hypothetical protein